MTISKPQDMPVEARDILTAHLAADALLRDVFSQPPAKEGGVRVYLVHDAVKADVIGQHKDVATVQDAAQLEAMLADDTSRIILVRESLGYTPEVLAAAIPQALTGKAVLLEVPPA